MNALELMKKRCSIRNYASTPVDSEKLNYVLEAARVAPSAVNYQPWYFLLIKEEKNREKLIECYPREWIKTAPMFIVVCGDHNQSWKRPADKKDHLDVDAGIVTEHICLAAAEKDLGTCIVCHFDMPLLKKNFNLPESIEPVVIIPIGHPAETNLFEKTPRKRKTIEEIVKQETF
ncbi:MAG: nitroreductase family protein [Tannerellaceae bacterium]|jgi:nitroreductase|nr:nitroreductase family protein [Tannerellaceae bacterium]